MEKSSLVTRTVIMEFPFPYKLWLLINIDNCDVLNWNEDGTGILLNLLNLENYLNTPRSIFKIKDCSEFLSELREFNFVRISVKTDLTEDVLMYFKNAFFQKHRLDLLSYIYRRKYGLTGPPPNQYWIVGDNKIVAKNLSVISNYRMRQHASGDLCFKIHGGLSNIQNSRSRFQALCHFQNEKKQLQEKIELANHMENRPSFLASTDGQVIELPLELFENPHDSVLQFGDEFHTCYAGYFGNADISQVKLFFQDYMPKYEDGYHISRNVSTGENEFNNTLSNAMIEESLPSNTNILNGQIAMTSKPDEYYNTKYSSTLEPIFKSEEELNSFNPLMEGVTVKQISCKSLADEPELSIDDFIKFNISVVNGDNNKDALNADNVDTEMTSHVPTESYSIDQEFAAIPRSVQIACENAAKDDPHFRHFFSQYRASLDVLYDKFS